MIKILPRGFWSNGGKMKFMEVMKNWCLQLFCFLSWSYSIIKFWDWISVWEMSCCFDSKRGPKTSFSGWQINAWDFSHLCISRNSVYIYIYIYKSFTGVKECPKGVELVFKFYNKSTHLIFLYIFFCMKL